MKKLALGVCFWLSTFSTVSVFAATEVQSSLALPLDEVAHLIELHLSPPRARALGIAEAVMIAQFAGTSIKILTLGYDLLQQYKKLLKGEATPATRNYDAINFNGFHAGVHEAFGEHFGTTLDKMNKSPEDVARFRAVLDRIYQERPEFEGRIVFDG